MKKYALTVLCLAFALLVNAQSLFIGTYNIRNDNKNDRTEGNGWPNRWPVICDMINFEQPDIFGTQEVFITQIRDLQRGLTGYDYIGVGRDDGKEAGEYSAIFYKKDKLKRLDYGNFWLNETPDVPKLGWDAACIRICTWGMFKDVQTKLKFYFFNLHMDHAGDVARREAAKLVVRKIREIAGEKAPVILTGDFNVDQNDEIYQIFAQSGILKDAYASAKQRFAENGTFQGFQTNLFTDSRIDHIFLSKQFEVDHFGILTNSYWTKVDNAEEIKDGNAPHEITLRKYTQRLPSDHYPIFAKIRYRK